MSQVPPLISIPFEATTRLVKILEPGLQALD